MGFLANFTKRGVEFTRQSTPKKKDKRKKKHIAKIKKRSKQINRKRK